jgi:NitT/TauT family transport system substrate-binding protein
VLSRALATVGLTLADVERQVVPPEEQLAAWHEGRVDAVVTYGPVATRLEHAGAQRLFDSRHMPNAIFDVLAVRQEQLDHPALPALVEAHFLALAHLEHNRDDALYRIAHRQQTNFAEVSEALAGITLPDLTGNRDLLRPQGPLHQVAADLNGLLVAEGLLAAPGAPADLDGLTEERFVRSLRMSTP